MFFSHALTYLEMILRAKVFIDNNKLIARVSLIITGASAREGQGGRRPLKNEIGGHRPPKKNHVEALTYIYKCDPCTKMYKYWQIVSQRG